MEIRPILDDFSTAGRFSIRALLAVSSWNTFFVASFLAVLTKVILEVLQSEISSSSAAIKDLLFPRHYYDPFDLKFGYGNGLAEQVLHGWGKRGIHLFYLFEMIDIFVFCTLYRAILIVLINRLFSFLEDRYVIPNFQCHILHGLFVLLPALITFLDYIEDVAQIAFCMIYQRRRGDVRNSKRWNQTVRFASLNNQLKWITVFIFAFVMLPFMLRLVIVLSTHSIQQRQRFK